MLKGGAGPPITSLDKMYFSFFPHYVKFGLLFLVVAAGEEMLTQLVLGWTALLSSLRQPAVDTSEYKHEPEATRRAQGFYVCVSLCVCVCV